MSVLANYVERLERSIERNRSVLESEAAEFENLCRAAVEGADPALLRQVRQWHRRAMARFQEIERVEQVLRGPRYRRLASAAPQREGAVLALRARYYQAYLPVERLQRWGAAATPPAAERGGQGGAPFRDPQRMEALRAMVGRAGAETAVSFILLQGEPLALARLSPAPLGPRAVVERNGPHEVRAALPHPSLLSTEAIEAVVRDRLLTADPRGRAAVYRLAGPADLATPFLAALALNLPRVAPGGVLTLNPAGAAQTAPAG